MAREMGWKASQLSIPFVMPARGVTQPLAGYRSWCFSILWEIDATAISSIVGPAQRGSEMKINSKNKRGKTGMESFHSFHPRPNPAGVAIQRLAFTFSCE